MALVGPRLAGVIVLLALRMRLSRASIRELLREVFDLTLSTGVIDETIREAGPCQFAAGGRLVADIVQVAQLHVDETSWPESGVLLWLWALVTTPHGALPHRPAQPGNAGERPARRLSGILISDGYVVYRAWENRLRCWPHLMRKLRGLAESSDGRVSRVGQEMEAILKTLMAAIYAARLDPPPKRCPSATPPR
jgi:transposase